MLNPPIEHERMSAYDYNRFRIETAIRLLRNDLEWPESALRFLEQTRPKDVRTGKWRATDDALVAS